MIVLYALLFFAVSLYSYSQIDLNLTLSSNPSYQYIQQQLIQVGYFNRPLSTWIFIGLIVFLFVGYITVIVLSYKKKITIRSIIYLILLASILLFFSYPAFSYDIFNYMFDARIVTLYHLNPYLHKALDFPDDLWLRFMHWTHRTYPYGPLWLVATIPFSAFGAGKFVLTLISFKLLFLLCYLVTCYLIWLISKKMIPEYALVSLVTYALNPLILIETLVSPHNEALLTVFFILALYLLYVKKRVLWAILALVISIGVKYVTAIVAPVFGYPLCFKKYISFPKAVWFMTIALCLPFIAEVLNREPYAWYLIPLLTISVFLVSHPAVIPSIIGISLGALLRYAPYLFDGSYPGWVLQLEDQLFYCCLTAGLLTSLYLWYQKNKRIGL
jgi:hypothetical protein